jgi:hypothetical protein
MAKTVKVEKEVFKKTLLKMLNTQPAPKPGLTKSKKKLARIVEPITR